MADRVVDVHVVIGPEELLAGRLCAHNRRGVESATFRYDPSYLASRAAYPLDPALGLVEGPQHTPVGRELFGAFTDCAPDRWGRRLLTRAERRRVADAGTGAERAFSEADFLLGVRDDLRQGGLRFQEPSDGRWLASDRGGVPHLVELTALLSASERMERDEETADELRELLHGGSSLGGARPKAHVLDRSGRIAIAKFPSPSVDEWDVIRWEAVALRLARRGGITVSNSRSHVIDGKGILIVERFDRVGRQRIGYASAMTMLEATDRDQASYLDLVEVIEEHSPAATRDLHELWRRLVFSILIRNTDDHLRNHGFLRTQAAGWSLSPAFDLNPDRRPGTPRLATSIDGRTDEARIDVAFEIAELFRLERTQARAALGQLTAAVATWRQVAGAEALPPTEIDLMARAFDHTEADNARQLATG